MMSISVTAATVIASYSGGGDPTTTYPVGTLRWRKETHSKPTNVESISSTIDGRNVMAILDPAISVLGNSNNTYFNASLSAATVADLMTTGWDLVYSVKIPSLAEVPGGAWTRNGSAVVGFYYKNPYVADQRIAWSMAMGRTASGQTEVSFGGTTFTLSSDFHEYRWAYRDGLVTFFIDGEAKVSSFAGTATTSTSGLNLLYWGDNSDDSTPPAYGSRVTYYESIQLIQVPEPSRTIVALMGCTVLCARRRR